jgi:LPS sulfotransferase NodH
MSYTKFVIIAQERTGSILLEMLLYSHGEVKIYGEIFNPNEEIRKRIRKRPIQLVDDPIVYLDNYVYKEYPESIQAVGFRLFYTHARNEEWKSVRDFLKDSKVRVIHLMRKNLLDRYLSHQLALRTDRWIASKEGERKFEEPITLSASDCFRDFYSSKWYQKEEEQFFNENPKTRIFYEDLCKYPKGEGERIQRFLGLQVRDLSTTTAKQRTQKKKEIIENYTELKEGFVKGVENGQCEKEWLSFFDDE